MTNRFIVLWGGRVNHLASEGRDELVVEGDLGAEEFLPLDAALLLRLQKRGLHARVGQRLQQLRHGHEMSADLRGKRSFLVTLCACVRVCVCVCGRACCVAKSC
jgi:hypothetical protein